MTIIFGVCLIVSLLVNAYTMYVPEAKTKVVYKEIEVVKRAVCECSHVSSMHKLDGTGSCGSDTFYIDGLKINKSIKCPCRRYTGPLPVVDYFDDQMRQIESTPFKELS